MKLPAELERRLAAVRSVGAISGAGVSAESGIRTYRGRGGVYDDPADGDRTVEDLSGHTLLADPDRTWRAVGRLARQTLGAEPNAAHRALAAIERTVESFVLLTQNVDGLHQRAGSRNVIDIHGSILAASCLSCAARRRFEPAELAAIRRTPRCSRCAGPLRPGAVLFGEMLPAEKVGRIHEEFHVGMADLVLVVGTSALFPYISAPVELAAAAGRLTVEINPEPTLLSRRVEHSLRGRAGDLLPLVAAALGVRI